MDDLDLGQTLRGFTTGHRVFERYELMRMLGRGGMGVVWLARDCELEQEVALKFLPEVVMGDRGAIDDMRRETKRARELTHPHIVRIHDFLRDSRMAAISMEYVPGDSLANRRLDRPAKVFEAADLLKWVEQLCSALDHAHAHARIVHRDLKPANLMLDGEGNLKVADFGISAMLADTTTRASHQASSNGTPVYMSPQQMMGELPAVTDDVYGVGATLYELLTGKPPFYTGNIQIQVQGKAAPSIADRRRELEVQSSVTVPAAWEETIAACLAKDAAQRPQSAGAILARLKGGADSLPVERASGAAVKHVAAAAPAKAISTVRPRPDRLVLTLSVVGALLALACGWLYFGVRDPETAQEGDQARREIAADAGRDRQSTKSASGRTSSAGTGGAATAPGGTEESPESSAELRGTLLLRTQPEGAEVRVGTVATGNTPLTLQQLKAGSHTVQIHLPGYEDWTGEVVVRPNDTEERTIDLIRSQGTLELTSDPSGSDVVVQCLKPEAGPLSNEARILQTPVRVELPTGDYAVTFRKEGCPEQSYSVSLGRKESLPLAAKFVTLAPNSAQNDAGKQGPTAPEVSRPWTVPDIGLEMVPIAAGDFVMGTHLWAPKRIAAVGLRSRTEMRVSLTRPYWIGKFEVTQGQWEAIMGYNPSSFKNVGRMAPVDSVSYTDAMSFCRRLTERERAAGRLPEGYEYTLPTEAQWEYACRAGRSGAPSDDLKVAGWYSRNSGKSTHPVGQQKPNEWGLYDMRGNVWEWCSDWMDDLPADSAVDPLGASTGRNKAVRGGGWDRPHDYCTPSFRGQFNPATISGALGLRLALAPVRNTPSG